MLCIELKLHAISALILGSRGDDECNPFSWVCSQLMWKACGYVEGKFLIASQKVSSATETEISKFRVH